MTTVRKTSQRRPITIDGGSEGSPPPGAQPQAERRRVGRLETLADWRRQIGKIYRAVRKGDMPSAEGTRLVYMLESGARIAREESRERHEAEQRAQVERLQQQLAELQGKRPAAAALPAPSATPAPLPSWAVEPATRDPKEPQP